MSVPLRAKRWPSRERYRKVPTCEPRTRTSRPHRSLCRAGESLDRKHLRPAGGAVKRQVGQATHLGVTPPWSSDRFYERIARPVLG